MQQPLSDTAVAGARRILAGYTPAVPTFDELVAAVNLRVREIHAIGMVVLLTEVHETLAGRALPQIHVDVRRAEDATSREEALDV